MSLGLLARQPLTWDSEAASYILQVEAADGQSLEPGVARAINTFVIDCKIRGIWGAIKSSCLLSGARTLNGALRPLKGTAPTNFNFTNSDYNRETGLKGNASSKYLNTNRLPLADSINNYHMSVYITGSISSGNVAYIGNAGNGNGATNLIYAAASGNVHGVRMRNSTPTWILRSTIPYIGFFGSSRDNSSSIMVRIGSYTERYDSVSETSPASYPTFVFGRTSTSGNLDVPSNPRLSFYSIGSAINLRLLEECITKYMYNISFHTSNNTIFALASNGDIISPTDYTLNGINYRVYTFSGSTGELRVLRSSNFDYLLVAGGGAGGSWYSGGGGAGGVLQGSVVLPIGSYPVVIGTGGLGVGGGVRGQNGGHSSFYNLLAVGGGGGARYAEAGADGGSGGGASVTSLPGAGKAGQGNRGGSFSSAGGIGGAGGGGAGGPAPDPTTNPGLCSFPGGSGIFSNMSGTSTLYASGGAGNCGGANATVIGGGGDGHFSNASNTPGGRGGNGILIIRHIL